MSTEKDFPLPKLNPFIELFPAGKDANGAPRWTIYNPLSNSYFRIEWPEFECLARFHRYKNAGALKDALAVETTLDIDLEDIKALIHFLEEQDLLIESKGRPEVSDQPVWKKLLKTYLFFTLPLVQPKNFLERTVHLVRPLINEKKTLAVFGVFIAALLWTLTQIDTFFATFPNLFTFEGILLSLLVFGLIKIFHELGHAYTATYYGVPVAHMGIAFMVLYPVLYTEASGSWRLENSRQRMHIGLAGIVTELYIATFFLILWNISPPGFLQTLSFIVVTITFIGSILINLNPLMRFDGYYVLSDILGYENLQDRSVAFARHAIRRVLLGIKDPSPEEDLSSKQKRFLTLFGLALLTYRFFLFIGIAILVYYIFFKPLGLFLMIVELWWFIGRPIWNELMVWWKRRREVIKKPRAQLVLGLVAIGAFLFILPVKTTIHIPAIRYAAQYQAIYPPAPSYIKTLKVENNQSVEEGDLLAELTSGILEKNISITKATLHSLKRLKNRTGFTAGQEQQRLNIEEQIIQKQLELDALHKERARLQITAPFSGTVVDLPPDIHAGRHVKATDLLFRILEKNKAAYTGFAASGDLQLIEPDQNGVFISDKSVATRIPLILYKVSANPVETLDWPELASNHSGPIASDRGNTNNGNDAYQPRNTVYRIDFKEKKSKPDAPLNHVEKGFIRVHTSFYSPALKYVKKFIAFFKHETALNT